MIRGLGGFELETVRDDVVRELGGRVQLEFVQGAPLVGTDGSDIETVAQGDFTDGLP
jgi:hypothetical protein